MLNNLMFCQTCRLIICADHIDEHIAEQECVAGKEPCVAVPFHARDTKAKCIICLFAQDKQKIDTAKQPIRTISDTISVDAVYVNRRLQASQQEGQGRIRDIPVNAQADEYALNRPQMHIADLTLDYVRNVTINRDIGETSVDIDFIARGRFSNFDSIGGGTLIENLRFQVEDVYRSKPRTAHVLITTALVTEINRSIDEQPIVRYRMHVLVAGELQVT